MPDGRKLVPLDALFELADRALLEDARDITIPTAQLRALLEHIETLGDALDCEAGDYCRVCGCTQNNPCEPPCGWAEEGLCTSCAPEAKVDDTDEWPEDERGDGEDPADVYWEPRDIPREP